MQKVDLRNKSFKQLLIKNQSGVVTTKKNKKLTFFSIEISFLLYFFRFINILCPDRSQKSSFR